ncbi:MAG: hypothetical protein HY052_04735 [Proteobacteria bacterium]|nr:hypothetical protein [Pseudomonadota bacterium]
MKLSKVFGIAALSITTLTAGVGTLIYHSSYSDGDRTGAVAKFSHKGFLSKTWEGELAMPNFTRGPDGTMTNSFEFSANDPKVIEKLQEANAHNTPVKLQYKQTYFHFGWNRDTDYLITDIQPTRLDQAAQNTPPMIPPQNK